MSGNDLGLPLDTIICGDNCEVMRTMPSESIDLVVTSPPYDDLRTYGGHDWDFYGVAWNLKRVLKLGGVLVSSDPSHPSGWFFRANLQMGWREVFKTSRKPEKPASRPGLKSRPFQGVELEILEGIKGANPALGSYNIIYYGYYYYIIILYL